MLLQKLSRRSNRINRSYYFSSISPQVHSSGMLQLTIALLFDLGLNRAGREDEGGPHDVLEESSKRGWVEASRKAWSASYNPREKKCTNAERRALLYLFYLTSMYVLFLIFLYVRKFA